MIRAQYVVNNLKKMGYGEYLFAPVRDTKVLYRLNPETSEPEMVVVVDCISQRVSNINAVNDIRKYSLTVDKLGVKNPKDIMVVLVGIFNSNLVSGHNVIRINNDTCKMRTSGVDKKYRDAKEACVYTSKLNKAVLRSKLAGLEADEKAVYSTWSLWLLIAFTLVFSVANFSRNDLYAISSEGLKNGECYRLITYMFVHLGGWHLVGNMAYLFYIGKKLMSRIGAVDFYLIYILGGIGSGAVSAMTYLTVFNRADMSTVGTSGALFAVLGAWLAYVFIDTESGVSRSVALRNSLIILILSSIGFGIDWVCHLSGFAMGVMAGVCLTYGRRVSLNANEFGAECSVDGIMKAWDVKVNARKAAGKKEGII